MNNYNYFVLSLPDRPNEQLYKELTEFGEITNIEIGDIYVSVAESKILIIIPYDIDNKLSEETSLKFVSKVNNLTSMNYKIDKADNKLINIGDNDYSLNYNNVLKLVDKEQLEKDNVISIHRKHISFPAWLNMHSFLSELPDYLFKDFLSVVQQWNMNGNNDFVFSSKYHFSLLKSINAYSNEENHKNNMFEIMTLKNIPFEIVNENKIHYKHSMKYKCFDIPYSILTMEIDLIRLFFMARTNIEISKTNNTKINSITYRMSTLCSNLNKEMNEVYQLISDISSNNLFKKEYVQFFNKITPNDKVTFYLI